MFTHHLLLPHVGTSSADIVCSLAVPADLVHFTDDKDLLKEYILNDSGSVFTGCATAIGSKPWSYGQVGNAVFSARFRGSVSKLWA